MGVPSFVPQTNMPLSRQSSISISISIYVYVYVCVYVYESDVHSYRWGSVETYEIIFGALNIHNSQLLMFMMLAILGRMFRTAPREAPSKRQRCSWPLGGTFGPPTPAVLFFHQM